MIDKSHKWFCIERTSTIWLFSIEYYSEQHIMSMIDTYISAEYAIKVSLLDDRDIKNGNIRISKEKFYIGLINDNWDYTDDYVNNEL